MPDDKPRLAWHSNAPWASTGYGQQTGLFVPRLKRDGWDLIVSAFYGLEGNMIGWHGIPVLPGIAPTFGSEELAQHALGFFGSTRGGMVVTLMDVFALNAKLMAKLNVASWCPVDHDPLPPLIDSYFRDSSAIPIAMSRFGEELLADFDPLYCPHGTDTTVFKPVDRDEAREAVGMPKDAFVVGMVAANKGNPSRKSFPHAFHAFKALKARHPEALLYLHTEPHSPSGINLPELGRQIGIEARYPDQYRYNLLPYQPEEMATIYSCFDVLLNPSTGEGFGLAPLEAQACGVPVIVTDFSAMSEVCGAGWKVTHQPRWSAQMAWQAYPDLEDIVESLESAYSMPAALREDVSKRARAHAMEYDAERVFHEHMVPSLLEAAQRFGTAGEAPSVRRLELAA